MIDVTHQISSVRRTVGNRVLEAGEARTVTISQTYNSDIEDVWDACTNPERIPRWFLPVEGDLRLGGRYQLQGNAGGKIERCDPPRFLAATWEYGGGMSWIEVRLAPDPDGGTRFELEHLMHVDDHWAEFGAGATGLGWDMAMIGLRLHLSSGSAVNPKEAEAWFASDEGKRFLLLAGDRWGEAEIAAGSDEKDARARAERTKAAYTASDSSGEGKN